MKSSQVCFSHAEAGTVTSWSILPLGSFTPLKSFRDKEEILLHPYFRPNSHTLMVPNTSDLESDIICYASAHWFIGTSDFKISCYHLELSNTFLVSTFLEYNRKTLRSSTAELSYDFSRLLISPVDLSNMVFPHATTIWVIFSIPPWFSNMGFSVIGNMSDRWYELWRLFWTLEKSKLDPLSEHCDNLAMLLL